ncbi:helix-turn-helix domain-containing protein [Salinispora arenicola]|uniref:helix-turn-helix domain-containing protein n=1 Tax=Salinispora arenicola TaxID=168697 RepID=UPI0004782815|nr:helix-turn-helix domain-containing protein [Salinispora arenicola]NIL59713.1 helix-turn-helix domain-containing protein [Salinispora arenicola]NIL64336.1 helix-turn-helix domain-containing protein [Salinispora arenicola]
MDTYLTVKEAATVMRVHTQTVYRFVWAGRLPRIDIGQGKSRPRFRVRESAVHALMQERERGKAI